MRSAFGFPFALAFGFAFANAGCARLPVAPPEATLRRYVVALEHDDASAAYALLSRQAQSARTRQEHARVFSASPADRRALATALSTMLSTEVQPSQEVRLTTSRGLWATLVPEPGSLRLTEPPSFAEGAESAEALLFRLEDALDRRDLAALVRLCTPRLATLVRDFFSDRARALKAFREKSPAPKAQGRIRLDGGHSVDLVESGGRWHLGDLN